MFSLEKSKTFSCLTDILEKLQTDKWMLMIPMKMFCRICCCCCYLNVLVLFLHTYRISNSVSVLNTLFYVKPRKIAHNYASLFAVCLFFFFFYFHFSMYGNTTQRADIFLNPKSLKGIKYTLHQYCMYCILCVVYIGESILQQQQKNKLTCVV